MLFRSAYFGLTAGLIVGLNEFYLRPLIPTETLRNRLVWYCWELFVVWQFIYLLFNYFWAWQPFSWFGYVDMLGELAAVMVVPVALTEVFSRLHRNQVPVKEKIVFEAENEKEKLILQAGDFLYATSSDNYIDIFFTTNGSLNHNLQRNTLKEVEKTFRDSPAVIRCHRSYIINPQRVIHLSESSRGGEVTLEHNIKLPVSKKYIQPVKAAVKAAP